MQLLVELSPPDLAAYRDAARLLRHALGDAAPELPRLLGLEFRQRRARTIAEEYLERHGLPSLRACARRRNEERKALRKAHQPGKTSRRPRRLPGIPHPERN